MIGPRWSDRQDQVFRVMNDDSVTTMVVPGPVQSGKTMAVGISFFQWATATRTEKDFIIATRTARQMDGAIIKYARQFAMSIGSTFKRRGEPYILQSALGGVNRFYPLIGSDKSSESKARSFSVDGALLDEATLLPQNFIDSVADRCSQPGAKLILVTNPAGPAHPVHQQYVLAADEDPALVHIPFQLSDNPTLSKAYIRGLERRYSGAQKRRMVYGEWAASEGLIYPYISESIGKPPPINEFYKFTMGIDYAHSSATHALMIGTLTNGRQWVLGEWRHHGLEQGQLLEMEQANRIRAWVGGTDVRRVYVDPNAPSFIQALRNVFRCPVTPADNDVMAGIQYVRQQTENGQLMISTKCKFLCAEMHNYTWDERAGLLGDDRPLKQNDHGCDALRYNQWTATQYGKKKVRVRYN